ncbi:MAG: class I SAM-dependent methyltransferase [Candidatus Eremiobacteraeota bacterium]|nr:class I SAM-dependent methyltransferase [Candidatus Eremiobacteraeota bacterium]MCW5867547.1 class I SAM-dependent methyltransferase [Candidatus Eremiobacteraeota bacterium]
MKRSRAHEAVVSDYLRLLRNTLSNTHYRNTEEIPLTAGEIGLAEKALEKLRTRFAEEARAGTIPQAEEVRRSLEMFTPEFGAAYARSNQLQSYTLLEASGLDNVEFCVRSLLEREIPGDLIECGVWRGGTCIYMRGLLKALGDSRRKVWVADSFQGLPEPDPEVSPLDAVSHEFLKLVGGFRVSLEAVQQNFAAFDLLDRQVRFLPGWFSHTLARAPIEKLALLRLDADYYESTVQALDSLYPRLSPGGFVIVDDYGIMPLGARRAVDEFRSRHGIEAPLVFANRAVAYWEK